MLTLRLLEVLAAILVLSEVIIPFFRGTPLCPSFRRVKEKELISELEHVRQDLVEDELREKVEALKAEHQKHQPKPDSPQPEPKMKSF